MGAGGMVLVHACWLPDAPMARALDFQLLPDVPRASKVVVEGMCGLGQSLCTYTAMRYGESGRGGTL
eukprot:914046-Pelagomonas_calceolata.AAC.1